MEAIKEVEYTFMVGLGPRWDQTSMTVFFDDLDESIEDWKIEEMAISEAKERLSKTDLVKWKILSVNNA